MLRQKLGVPGALALLPLARSQGWVAVGTAGGTAVLHEGHRFTTHTAVRFVGIGAEIARLGKDISAFAAHRDRRQFGVAFRAGTAHDCVFSGQRGVLDFGTLGL
jgi:hypothetical protein